MILNDNNRPRSMSDQIDLKLATRQYCFVYMIDRLCQVKMWNKLQWIGLTYVVILIQESNASKLHTPSFNAVIYSYSLKK